MQRGSAVLGLCLGLGLAMAQNSPQAATPQNTTPQATTAPAAPAAARSMPAEMKTTAYRGMLVDMSCAGQAAGSAAPAAPTPANRTTGECAASANSSQLGLKMDNGRTLKFDLVGNQRALDELKTNKRWSRDAAGSRPIRARVDGVIQGDKLIVSSIH